MTYPALHAVECAILHEEFRPIDGRLIYDRIKQLAIDLGFGPDVNQMITSTEEHIHIFAGDHRVLISQNAHPLADEGFRNALSTPYTGIAFPDARQAVEQHKANTFVTIGKGVIDVHSTMPEGLNEILGQTVVNGLHSYSTWVEAERAMILCREITKLIIEHHAASGIHWCVSDNLVPQAFFESACDAGDFIMLGARPFLSSSAGRMGPGLPLGSVFNGSQWLIGKLVIFEEATVPFPWMLDVVMNFIKVCQIRGSIIPHKESFSVEGEDWTIGVFHDKIEGHDDWECVKLLVVKAPEFGIHRDTTARNSYFYRNEEDIRARAEQEKHEVRAANDVDHTDAKTFDLEDDLGLEITDNVCLNASADEMRSDQRQGPQEFREKVAQKANVRALRSLAKQSADQLAQNAASQDKSVLGKVAGLFSRN